MTNSNIHDVITKTKNLRPALSYKCELQCEACYARDLGGGRMSVPFFVKLLDEGLELGFNTVSFGGGEPLEELPLLKKCITEARNRGYDTAITTNGKRLTPSMIRDLERVGLDFFQLSVGFNRLSSWDILNVLRDAEASFGINFLVDRTYIGMLPLFHDVFEQRGVSYVTYILPKSMRPKTEFMKFNRNEILKYFEILTKIKNESKLPFVVGCVTNAIEHEMECLGTEKGITISPTGKISTCAFCDTWVHVNGLLKDAIVELDGHYTGKCLCLDKTLDVQS